MNRYDDQPKVYLYKRIVQAKLFIDSHFAEALDLADISSEASFSKFHFIRLFKTIYGKTPHQYVIARRIERSKELLDIGETVSNTCSLVGFESITSFTGLFKRQVGMSPAKYQQKQLRRRAEVKSNPLRFIPNCFAEQKGWT